MEYTCPACKHPLDPAQLSDAELSEGDDLTLASCPKCGTALSGTGQFGVGETMTFRRGANEEGSAVAHFSLIRELGRGGFGTVWLAEDLDLGRQVALKLPSKTGNATANLPHEAKTAAKLKHPNIVSVYEIGSDGAQPYIACEFINGLNLQDTLSINKPSLARAVELIVAIGKALQHAHANGVVHRDVKPANILISQDGQPFVTDFGIAKQVSTEATISSDGQIIGTMRYMSPEQAAGKTQETDHRSDIYALGVILFEMVTGERPFRGTARALIHQKLNEDAPSPRKLDATLPKDIETICLKCLEREPGQRYQSAQELVDELERFASGTPILARPVSAGEKAWRWCRRRPAVASLLATTMLSLSLGLLGVGFFGWQAKQSAEQSRQALYRSRMNLAREYWQRGDITAIQEALAPYSDGQPADHYRGFEWYYYDRLVKPFLRVVNHGDVLTAVAISRDGQMAASHGADHVLCVWDAKSGKRLDKIQLPDATIQAIGFSPANTQLAAGASDGMIHIWDPLQAGRKVREFKHGPSVHHLRYSRDGKRLVSSGKAGAVRLWDPASGEMVAVFPSGALGVKCLRFSPDGALLAVATKDGRVRIWDIAAGTQLGTWDTDPNIETLAFNGDGKQFVTGGVGGKLRVWSVATGAECDTYQTFTGIVGDLDFVKNSNLLVALGLSGQTIVIDTNSRSQVSSLRTHNLAAGMMAQAANGQTLVVGSGDGTLKIIDVAKLIEPMVFWHGSHLRDVQFLPSNGQLVTATGDGTVNHWNVATGRKTELAIANGREMLALSVQGSGPSVTSVGATRKVIMRNMTTGDVSEEFQIAEKISSAVFSPSGRRLALAGVDGKVRVYQDQASTAPFFPQALMFTTAPQQKAMIHALAFSQNEREIAVALSDNRVEIWDTHTGTAVTPPIELAATPRALTFCQTDQTLAIGTQTGEIQLWDRRAGRIRQIIKAHSSRINVLTAFPDGKTVVSGGRDKGLRLWDVGSGELLSSLHGHGRQIFCVGISPDGKTIASGELSGALRIWRGDH